MYSFEPKWHIYFLFGLSALFLIQNFNGSRKTIEFTNKVFVKAEINIE